MDDNILDSITIPDINYESEKVKSTVYPIDEKSFLQNRTVSLYDMIEYLSKSIEQAHVDISKTKNIVASNNDEECRLMNRIIGLMEAYDKRIAYLENEVNKLKIVSVIIISVFIAYVIISGLLM